MTNSNSYFDPMLANQMRNALEISGHKLYDKYIIRKTTDMRSTEENEKSLIDILEMVDDVNLPTDYFKSHVIFEHWFHDILPDYWIPVELDQVVRKGQDVAFNLMNEVMQDARPRRVSMIILTLEALKQAHIKDIPQEK